MPCPDTKESTMKKMAKLWLIVSVLIFGSVHAAGSIPVPQITDVEVLPFTKESNPYSAAKA